eukprot:jgi/Botrbrau1/1886/Bobra.0005s0003.1
MTRGSQAILLRAKCNLRAAWMFGCQAPSKAHSPIPKSADFCLTILFKSRGSILSPLSFRLLRELPGHNEIRGFAGQSLSGGQVETDAAVPEERDKTSKAHRNSKIWENTRSSSSDGGREQRINKKGSDRESEPLLFSKVFQDDEHGIKSSSIPQQTMAVLLRLRGAGHEGYVVGGAVRDLLLEQQPKDFDIVTSATPHQVKSLFSRSIIIGQKFPIVQVRTGKGHVVEVSSFSTRLSRSEQRNLPLDVADLLSNSGRAGGSPSRRSRQRLTEMAQHASRADRGPKSKGADGERKEPTWAEARRVDASRRDFTVNALFFDPFAGLVYDYVSGVRDCRRRVLQCVKAPEESFQEDPARVLRAIRHASRSGLRVSDTTGRAILKHSQSSLALPQGRIMMEVNALMAYGSSSPAVQLMWRYGVLKVLFPIHAAYLQRKGHPKNPRKIRQEPLFELLDHIDSLASPQRPLRPSVWISALAAPLIAEAHSLTSSSWRHPLVEQGAREVSKLDDEDDTASDHDENSSPPFEGLVRKCVSQMLQALPQARGMADPVVTASKGDKYRSIQILMDALQLLQAEGVLGGKAKSLDQSLCSDTRMVKDTLARWSLGLHHKIDPGSLNVSGESLSEMQQDKEKDDDEDTEVDDGQDNDVKGQADVKVLRKHKGRKRMRSGTR